VGFGLGLNAMEPRPWRKKWVYGVVVVLCRGREKSKVVVVGFDQLTKYKERFGE
jgi:hypothetical protein